MELREDVTHERLLACLRYAKSTGVFKWRRRPLEHFASVGAWKSWNSKHAGKVAGTKVKNGYVSIGLDGVTYMAHRLAWFYVTGVWPRVDIDHKNEVTSDNRFRNLRPASRSQNIWNTGMRSSNTSGIKGAQWHKKNRRWVSVIIIGGVRENLGSFDTAEEAGAAYARAARVRGAFEHKSTKGVLR